MNLLAEKVTLEGNLPCSTLHLERIFQACSLKSLARLFQRRRKERDALGDAMYFDPRLRKFAGRCIQKKGQPEASRRDFADRRLEIWKMGEFLAPGSIWLMDRPKPKLSDAIVDANVLVVKSG